MQSRQRWSAGRTWTPCGRAPRSQMAGGWGEQARRQLAADAARNCPGSNSSAYEYQACAMPASVAGAASQAMLATSWAALNWRAGRTASALCLQTVFRCRWVPLLPWLHTSCLGCTPSMEPSCGCASLHPSFISQLLCKPLPLHCGAGENAWEADITLLHEAASGSLRQAHCGTAAAARIAAIRSSCRPVPWRLVCVAFGGDD